MYLAHYGLKKKPFSTNPDPNFLWFGEAYKEALAELKYGILETDGFLLLTGDIGTGKTSLLNYLVKLIGEKALVAMITDPVMEPLDFFNYLAAQFKMGHRYRKKGEFLIHFKQFLLQSHANRKRVILIIDEAQRLSNGLLEEIRLLSNTQAHGKRLLKIFFVGQNEFNNLLKNERNRPFRQRITLNYRIAPLTKDEVQGYINYRLKAAGATYEIFSPEAINEIYATSYGIPRLINTICDCALLSGYARGYTRIAQEEIKECELDLRLTIGSRPARKNEPAVFSEDDIISADRRSQKVILILIVALLILIGITLLAIL